MASIRLDLICSPAPRNHANEADFSPVVIQYCSISGLPRVLLHLCGDRFPVYLHSLLESMSCTNHFGAVGRDDQL